MTVITRFDVGALQDLLAGLPRDTPVMFTWDGGLQQPCRITIEDTTQYGPVLLVDVEEYHHTTSEDEPTEVDLIENRWLLTDKRVNNPVDKPRGSTRPRPTAKGHNYE